MNKFISVIIVSGRDSSFLIKTLSKLAKTKYLKESFEIVVVRDSKSDDCEFNRKFPNIKIKIKKTKFEGMSNSRNIGTKLTSKKSEIVAFIDDDAVPTGDWIYEINSFFDKNLDKNILAGKIIPIRNKTLASKYSDLFSAHDARKYGLPIGANMAFRSSLIKLRNHDECFKRGYDDFDYAMQFILEGNKMGYSDKVSVKHENPNSIMNLIKKGFQSSRYSILFFNKYKQNPFHIEDILVLLLFIALFFDNLFFKYGFLFFSLISLANIFYVASKNKKVNLFDYARLFILFLIIRIFRLFGKICGLIKWGALQCRRS